MRIWKYFLFWFFFLLFAINTILFLFFKFNSRNTNSSNITSPLSKKLTENSYLQVNASEFWNPLIEDVLDSEFQISALSALSYDLTTNTILYSKNANEKLPIASLTKIMTAVITLENNELENKIKITKEAAAIGEGTMGLSEGETHIVEDLLFGLLLQSGNDAAEALSYGSKFGREDFVHLMNKKSEDLGLINTRFTNPSGLQGDGEQYSTSKELLILTRYALSNPEFARIVATYEYSILKTSDHKEYTLYNETNLLTTYPGVRGVKTGFTDEAGMCLVTYLDYKGHQTIAVLLNSNNRRQEMRDLLDYSLRKLGVKPPSHT